jgi:cellulose biosynthesis protein BcsQ
MWEWLKDFLSELFQLLIAQPLAIVSAVVVFALVRPLWLRHRAYLLIQEAQTAVAQQTGTNGLQQEGPGFWLKMPISKPERYDERMRGSIPIMMIGTLKGGVGKTTLSANLAAQFAIRWRNANGNPLRVLLIDLDFQGSLSTMTVLDAQRFAQPCKANLLVSGRLSEGRLVAVSEPISRAGMRENLSIRNIPAYYDLAQAENRAMIEWLLPAQESRLLDRLLKMLKQSQDARQSNVDVRYRLAEALLDEQVQGNFDLVVIDAPPRLTTSHIQAICASTHVLIPTILDRLANDAVARYIDQIATHKLGPDGNQNFAIAPHIQPLRVVATLVPPNVQVQVPLNVLEAGLAGGRLIAKICSDTVRQRAPYRECAGDIIAYASLAGAQPYQALRQEIDSIADELAGPLGAQSRGWRAVPEV